MLRCLFSRSFWRVRSHYQVWHFSLYLDRETCDLQAASRGPSSSCFLCVSITNPDEDAREGNESRTSGAQQS